MSFTSTEWLWAVMIVVLGVAIAYATLRGRRSRAEKRMMEQATKRVYREEDDPSPPR